MLLADVVQWAEVVGFFDWFSRATAFGAMIAGAFALTAAWLAYHGVKQTIRSAEDREAETRSSTDRRELDSRRAVDAREREKARHERFTTTVTQLASEHSMVRMGGLFAMSALADEWEREARRLIRESDSDASTMWASREAAWAAAMERRALAQQELSQYWEATFISGEADPQTEKQLDDLEARLIQAHDEAQEASQAYTLTQDTVPLAAKDAVTHRDNCMELVTAYLRTSLDSLHTQDVTEATDDRPQPETVEESEPETRAAATTIVIRHTGIDATYPWPTQQINLNRAQLRGVDLSNADLEGANLREVSLHNADLSSANLKGADLRWATLTGSDLSEANLEGANLSKATLTNAYLPEANLQAARLNHAHLAGADLQEATLKLAGLAGAYLVGASLAGASLDGADLSGATLLLPTESEDELVASRAGGYVLDRTMTHAGQMTLADVTEEGEPLVASWSATTRWPADFNPEAVAAQQLAAAEARWSQTQNQDDDRDVSTEG
ncbi:pentapeptide repeat-containing protein [Kocuria rosea]|uniref:pentapeptide repeat-containing protein n=1 Tax=Kocuria rosea TaxID=1275 RepID=UPI00140C0726|nr:pentapeptide repeat-containing protein [Kocuria rosea]